MDSCASFSACLVGGKSGRRERGEGIRGRILVSAVVISNP